MSAVYFVSRYTEATPNNTKHSYSTVLNKPHYSNLHYPTLRRTLLYTIALSKLHRTLLPYTTLSYSTPHSPTLCHTLLHSATLSYTTPHSPTLLHTLLQLSNGK